MGSVLVNCTWMKESGKDPTLENQIVRATKIGPCQPNEILCIHPVVNNMIIIKGQNHNYLILTCQVLWPRCKMHANTKIFVNPIYASHRKCLGFGWQCIFVKGRGCNDKSLHRTGVTPSISNIKHVHMCIILMTNRVMQDYENKPCW